MHVVGRRLLSGLRCRQFQPLRTLRLHSTLATVAVSRLTFLQPRTSAVALLSLAAFVSSSVALAAPLKKMESADAVRAEELYNDKSYDRRTLLVELRQMHVGAASCAACRKSTVVARILSIAQLYPCVCMQPNQRTWVSCGASRALRTT